MAVVVIWKKKTCCCSVTVTNRSSQIVFCRKIYGRKHFLLGQRFYWNFYFFMFNYIAIFSFSICNAAYVLSYVCTVGSIGCSISIQLEFFQLRSESDDLLFCGVTFTPIHYDLVNSFLDWLIKYNFSDWSGCIWRGRCSTWKESLFIWLYRA